MLKFIHSCICLVVYRRLTLDPSWPLGSFTKLRRFQRDEKFPEIIKTQACSMKLKASCSRKCCHTGQDSVNNTMNRKMRGQSSYHVCSMHAFMLNPLGSNGDQRQISLCGNNAFSGREVMRIKDAITQHEFRW